MVNERSSNDEADNNSNRISAVQNILRRLDDEVVFDQECSKMSEDIGEEDGSDGS